MCFVLLIVCSSLYVCVCECLLQNNNYKTKHKNDTTSNQHSSVWGQLRECRSIRSGASGLPYYCAPLACVSAVMELLTVWWHNKPKTKNQKPKTKNVTTVLDETAASDRVSRSYSKKKNYIYICIYFDDWMFHFVKSLKLESVNLSIWHIPHFQFEILKLSLCRIAEISQCESVSVTNCKDPICQIENVTILLNV